MTPTVPTPIPHERCVVIGGGLAGTEAAWQLAERDIPVTLVEMRPSMMGPAHHTGMLAELVCSNSLKTLDVSQAAGELKRELTVLGSMLLDVARRVSVPAGTALAVDRNEFAARVTHILDEHPLVTVVRQERTSIPGSCRTIVASGPLTSASLEGALSDLVGHDRLAFFDAAAPIVDDATVDHEALFRASRYGKGEGADYLNIPLSRDEYYSFRDCLVGAERTQLKEFETADLFHACQPIEEIARSSPDAMRFGPLKPVGLSDPETGARPWAVVQLRAENASRTAYNIVGFQTNLTFSEQRRVFGMLPGLHNADFLRFGVMHRNTYLDAPRLLDPTLALRSDPRIRFAGQITGTEGYVEAIASGLLAGINTAANIQGSEAVILPPTTALGALIAYATNPETTPYQPMHVNWGLVPPLAERVRGKRERYAAYALRAHGDLVEYISAHPFLYAKEVTDAY